MYKIASLVITEALCHQQSSAVMILKQELESHLQIRHPTYFLSDIVVSVGP